ncbi:hypothetical protein NPX13_g8904 [Xylaria arbuscula]|uniref:Glutathione-specific gamma-glutamylcyclotransferase n=1 Tax=Xylaria arbuscula TaxID=114810 RepID=A0A9W8N7T4_9PEZI|nr:hypothetical protein NPX13_g8904 [Xylaria arbuscula]
MAETNGVVVDAGGHPAPSSNDEFWIFGYGSLIWKPPPHYGKVDILFNLSERVGSARPPTSSSDGECPG